MHDNFISVGRHGFDAVATAIFPSGDRFFDNYRNIIFLSGEKLRFGNDIRVITRQENIRGVGIVLLSYAGTNDSAIALGEVRFRLKLQQADKFAPGISLAFHKLATAGRVLESMAIVAIGDQIRWIILPGFKTLLVAFVMHGERRVFGTCATLPLACPMVAREHFQTFLLPPPVS